eukprot:TRINITY_DN3890_c0_g1_i6.p3 TRINITY_DN3890_c0_g1~~TRINITY_DN3890_c0_g1_i6.p3  ORF type:complete len:103 (+),score=23.63 TRINITY_DN3890_c0_g1_i6:155-463(+)
MVKVDENTVLTGAEDGFLRGVGIQPNKILKVLGKHADEDENFPVQSVAVSRCKRFAATTSHDYSIKFYDIAQFVDQRSSYVCLLYTSPSPRDRQKSRMPSSA